jgi:hypothetical protein
MTVATTAIGVDIELALQPGTDPRAPGGEVTRELCGHWEHEGPCRWPHNSSLASATMPARLRTVVVVPDAERDEIVGRIEAALRNDRRWTVVSFSTGPVRADEQALANRLRLSC